MAQQLTKAVAIVGGIQFKRTGVRVISGAGAPVNGVAGTGAGLSAKGSLYIDTTNGVMYMNTNTKASPTWSTNTRGNVSGAGGRVPVLTKTANYPLVVADSLSYVIVTPAAPADIVITLPAPSNGLEFVIIVGAVSSVTGLTVATNAGAEKVFGHGITAAAGKGVINTHATENLGDSIRILSNGTDWFITMFSGTWARVA